MKKLKAKLLVLLSVAALLLTSCGNGAQLETSSKSASSVTDTFSETIVSEKYEDSSSQGTSSTASVGSKPSDGVSSVKPQSSSKAPANQGPKVAVATTKNFLPLTASGDQLINENPDRGYRSEYVWYVKRVAHSANPVNTMYGLLDMYVNNLPEPTKLLLVYTYLTDYRNTEIDDAGMEAMENFYELCRNKGIKIMQRFSYCDSFTNLNTGADQTTMLRHMRQVSEQVKRNADVIHSISSGFIGAYGEWVDVYQVPRVNYTEVLNGMIKYLSEPAGLYIQLRLPEFKNLISPSSKYYNMIGHHNDAMFGAQNKKDWESGGYFQGTPQWNQVIKEGHLTPQDGEMFTNSVLVDTNRKPSGMEIILETAHHRHTSMSFWHGWHEVGSIKDKAVMNAWKSAIVTPAILDSNYIVYDPNWFKDDKGNNVRRNAFEFIRDHLGYKVTLQSVKISGQNKAGSTAKVDMKLKNYGMSAAFNLESGYVILDQDYNVVSKVKAGSPTKWYSHEPGNIRDTRVPIYSVAADMKLPTKSGRYHIAYYLCNTMGDFARMSNRSIEVADGYHILHSFDI